MDTRPLREQEFVSFPGSPSKSAKAEIFEKERTISSYLWINAKNVIHALVTAQLPPVFEN